MVEVYLIQGWLGITTYNLLLIKIGPNSAKLCSSRFHAALKLHFILDIIQVGFTWRVSLSARAVTDDRLVREVSHSVQSW